MGQEREEAAGLEEPEPSRPSLASRPSPQRQRSCRSRAHHEGSPAPGHRENKWCPR